MSDENTTNKNQDDIEDLLPEYDSTLSFSETLRQHQEEFQPLNLEPLSDDAENTDSTEPEEAAAEPTITLPEFEAEESAPTTIIPEIQISGYSLGANAAVGDNYGSQAYSAVQKEILPDPIPIQPGKYQEPQEPEEMGYYPDGTPTYAQAIEDNTALVKEKDDALEAADNAKVKRNIFWAIIGVLTTLFLILLALFFYSSSANNTLKNRVNESSQTQQQNNEEIRKLQGELGSQKETIEGLNQKLNSTEQQLTASRNNANAKSTQVDALNREVDNLNAQLDEAKNSAAAKQGKINQLQRELNRVKNKPAVTTTVTETEIVVRPESDVTVE